MVKRTMPEESPHHFVFIVNPQAGKRNSRKLLREMRKALSLYPEITCEYVLTERSEHATELAAEFARRYGKKGLIFACGGDGTVNEVLNGLAGTEAAMGVIPMGTANDFAHAALSTSRLKKLLPLLPHPQIRPIDVIDFDGRFSLNILSLGLDSMVQTAAMRINRRWHLPGSLIYPLAVVAALRGRRVFSMHYAFDSPAADGTMTTREGDQDFILAAICNGRYYGGGFNPAPTALLDDGKLDICLVDSLPLHKILPMIPRYKKGKHLDSPAIKFFAATGGRIWANGEKLPGNADGELFSRERLEFKVLPGHLRFAFY